MLKYKALWTLFFLCLSSSCIRNKTSNESFINGVNIAWVNFAQDVGTGKPPLTELQEQFHALGRMTSDGGHGVARLWIHTDARLTPEFNAAGYVVGPGTHTLDDLKAIFDLAEKEQIKIMPVLWSHDLLRSNEGAKRSILERNKNLLSKDLILSSYIENSLKPMVKALDAHPALYAWEIMNEPEGVTTEENWDIIDPQDRQKVDTMLWFLSRQVGAIRRTAKGPTLVTVGAVSAKYLSLYATKRLKQFDPDGYLDFFQIHYYEHMPEEYNPFLHRFEAEKPILVGEFYPHQWQSFGSLTARRQMYFRLRENGYMGAMAWKDSHYPALGPILEAIGYNRERAW